MSSDAGDFDDTVDTQYESEFDLGGPLPVQARRALVTLLTSRYITHARNRSAWKGLVDYEEEIRQRLDEMFLDLVVDRETEVAFKRQQEGEDIPKVLRREKPLSRDASFVLIFLRRECAYADSGDGPTVITRDQIGEFLRTFGDDRGEDNSRFERRLDAAISALVRPLQLLTPDPDADYLFTISPVVIPLVGVDEIQRFEAAFRKGVEPETADVAVVGMEVEEAQ